MRITIHDGNNPIDSVMEDFYKESFVKMQNHAGNLKYGYNDDGRKLSPDEIVLREKDLERGPFRDTTVTINL